MNTFALAVSPANFRARPRVTLSPRLVATRMDAFVALAPLAILLSVFVAVVLA